MSYISDDEILKILKRGDDKSLSLIYEKYSETLYISAYNMLKNKEACEDIIQEVFISIWNKRKNLKINTSLKSYLHTSVMYGVYSYYRKNSNKMNVELLEGFNTHVQYDNAETLLIQKEIISQINYVVKSLPKKCRLVFELSRNEQLSHNEIAEKLNISTKTIEAHITKALKAIRSSLGTAYSIDIILYIVLYYI